MTTGIQRLPSPFAMYSKLLLVLSALLMLFFLIGPEARGQAPRGDSSAAATSPKSGTQPDANDAFRHSAAVRWMARTLHMDIETTAKLFEDINSGVLIAAIVVFLVRTIPKAYRGRRKTIQAALTDARSATEQANQRLLVVEERLSRLDSEIEAIRQQAERDGVEDEARIRRSIEEESRRIVDSAEHEIESAGVAAQRQLKQFAAELAIERATRELRLSPEADRLLVSDFGRQLNAPGLGRGGRN